MMVLQLSTADAVEICEAIDEVTTRMLRPSPRHSRLIPGALAGLSNRLHELLDEAAKRRADDDHHARSHSAPSPEPTIALAIRNVLDSAGVEDVNDLAAIFKASGYEHATFTLDGPTQAMSVAIYELWSTRPGPTRPENIVGILRHSMQLGLALLCKCWDEPTTYNPPHDGCLDLIDSLRARFGLPLTGEADPGTVSEGKNP
jgi:hypothetical protein